MDGRRLLVVVLLPYFGQTVLVTVPLMMQQLRVLSILLVLRTLLQTQLHLPLPLMIRLDLVVRLLRL